LDSLVSLFGSGYVQNRNECVNMRRFVLDLTLSVNPGVRRTLVTKTSIGAYERLFSYLRTFPLQSKKHISFTRFHKVWIRLHDGLIRKNRSLKRLKALVSTINRDLVFLTPSPIEKTLEYATTLSSLAI
jgi:hypothetical protein